MPSTVKVPLLGQQNKGTVVGVTIGGFAIAGYMIYRSRKKAQAAQAAATDTAQASSAYGYGTGQAYPGGYYGYGEPGITYGEGASGGFYPQGYYGYGTPAAGGVPNATNAQWAQAAINQLTSEGYDAQTVSAALGAYELGQPVTPAQQTIVQAAIGVEGYPPDSGANGFPPGIHVQGTTGGGTGGGQSRTGGGGTPPPIPPNRAFVPKVVGDRANKGLADLRQAGFKARTVPFRNPRREYVITAQHPAAGTQANRGSLVTVNVQATR